jgi:N-acetylglucosamine transport system permease protein
MKYNDYKNLLSEDQSKVKNFEWIFRLMIRVFLMIITISVVYPLLWNVLASLKTNQEFLANPWSLPKGFYFQNYINAFTKGKIGDYFLNSMFVVILSLLLLLIFTVPISYVLAKFKFPGVKLLRNIFIACLFIQPTYIIVPLFLSMAGFNMLDNRVWLSVVYAVFQFPFSVFLLSAYMKAIPGEYEESAMIDGASHFTVLYKVIMPLTKPGIITVSILAVFGFWNEYPLALTLLSSDVKKTIPVGLANLFEVQRYATDWGALFAALTMVLIPTVIIFIIGQKKLTQGMTVGGLKG